MTTDLTRETFALHRPPFSKDIDDSDLWVPDKRKNIIDRLETALETRACGYITGESGTGKTCILRALRARMHPSRFRLTYCHDATLGRRDFYRQVCHALGLKPKATAGSLFRALATHVETLRSEQHVHSVLLIDEAHLLQESTLEHLHIILNYQWDQKPLLSIFLVGLPDLIDRLRLRRHRSLLTRMSARERIEPITPNDTADYIGYRLETAGAKNEIFAPDAVSLVHEYAEGNLRDIDTLAARALADTAAAGNAIVTRDVVTQAAKDTLQAA